MTGGDTPLSLSPFHAEALAVPVALWADLPAPSSLRVRTESGRLAWLTASRSRLQASTSGREAAFGPNEYEAAVGAILEARATSADLDRWIDRKLEAPGWVLTYATAFTGALDCRDPRSGRVAPHALEVAGLPVTWASALERMRCELVGVVVEAPLKTVEVTGQELAQL